MVISAKIFDSATSCFIGMDDNTIIVGVNIELAIPAASAIAERLMLAVHTTLVATTD